MVALPDLPGFLRYVGKSHRTEDTIDRLNSIFTFFLLFIFALFVFCKQTFGTAIHCYGPRNISEAELHFCHDICYNQKGLMLNKFDLTDEQKMQYNGTNPAGGPWELTYGRVYYQWIPYILFLQAFLFLIPRYSWKLMVTLFCSGDEIETIISETVQIASEANDRSLSLKALIKFIKERFSLGPEKTDFGRSTTVCYVIKKWIAVANVVAQFLVMAWIIPQDFNILWIRQVLSYRWHNSKYDVDLIQGLFPTLATCDINRITGFVEDKLSLPCTLPINYLNEKIYVIIYFWLILLFFINSISVMSYTVFLLSKKSRASAAESMFPPFHQLFTSAPSVKHTGAKPNPVNTNQFIDHFLQRSLNTDGIFMFVFIFKNAGGMLTFELCQEIWNICVQPSCEAVTVTVCSADEVLKPKWVLRTLAETEESSQDLSEKKPLLQEISLSRGTLNSTSMYPTATFIHQKEMNGEANACEDVDSNEKNNKNNS